jgi:hypothetical protein
LPHLLCAGGMISLPWFSKELKNDLSKNNWLRGVILIFLVRESIFVGPRFSFPIVLVPRYKNLCVTLLSNLIYLVFRELMSWHDHEVHIMRFASVCILSNQTRKPPKPNVKYIFISYLKKHWMGLFRTYGAKWTWRGLEHLRSMKDSL